MTDLGNRAFELAAQRADQERDAGVARAIAELAAAGALDCVDCGQPIAAARRLAIPSACRCVDCQGSWERGRN